MASDSVVPEGIAETPVKHPLAEKYIKSVHEDWDAMWRTVQSQELLSALLEVGLSDVVYAGIMRCKHRIVDYLRIADGYDRAEVIIPPRCGTWAYSHERKMEPYLAIARKALECLARDFFEPSLRGKLDDRISWTNIIVHDDELFQAIMRFADPGKNWFDHNLPAPHEKGETERLFREFLERLVQEAWQTEHLQELRPTFVHILDRIGRIDVLIEKEIHVDKPSMKVLEDLAMRKYVGGRDRYASIDAAVADHRRPAEILVLLRIRHKEYKRMQAAREAERLEREEVERR